MSVISLIPTIHSILSAPETDLQTISAKRVRKLIPELRPDISPEFIKANKGEVNNLIEKIFETFNQSNQDKIGYQNSRPEIPSPTSTKRKREDTPENQDREEEGEEDLEEERSYDSKDDRDGSQSNGSKPVTKPTKPRPSGITDEAYARQLSSELNQRPSRTNRQNAKANKSSSRASKSKKSRSEIVDSDEDENGDDGDKAVRNRKPSKSRRKGSGSGEAKGGFAKEFALSEPLSVVVGKTQLSRPQVVKRLWEYIKSNQLQNPSNRKEILCDDSLRNLFSTDKINMFTMNKILSNHLYELE